MKRPCPWCSAKPVEIPVSTPTVQEMWKCGSFVHLNALTVNYLFATQSDLCRKQAGECPKS